MDIKLQAYRGDLGPEKVDFRGENFVGSPEDEHRTALEARVTEEDLAELGLTEEEFFASLVSTNKILALVASKQHDSTGNLASLLGLSGSGPVKVAVRAYDND